MKVYIEDLFNKVKDTISIKPAEILKMVNFIFLINSLFFII